MTSSINDKKPCTKCNSQRWMFVCENCHESFRVNYASGHRTKLLTKPDNIEQQYDLSKHINNQHETCQEHPLFSQINVWERDTISKIQLTAQTARDELQQILDKSTNRMKIVYNRFLDQRRKTDHHSIETGLDQRQEQLINLRKQMKLSSDMKLISNENALPIYLIKVITTQQYTQGEISLVSSLVQPNNVEYCGDDKLDKSQSVIIDIHNDSSIKQLNEISVMPKEQFETNLHSCDTQPVALQLPLDPTRTNHFLVLQLSSPIQSQIPGILNKLIDYQVQIFNKKDECLDKLKYSEQATIFIDTINILPDERNHLLDNIAELDNVHFIYIRGIPPTDDNERNYFFRRYSRIKAMFDNEQRLMVQWAIDTANEYKNAGDVYTELGDKDRGHQCFEQGVKLYKHLSVFLNEKRRVR